MTKYLILFIMLIANTGAWAQRFELRNMKADVMNRIGDNRAAIDIYAANIDNMTFDSDIIIGTPIKGNGKYRLYVNTQSNSKNTSEIIISKYGMTPFVLKFEPGELIANKRYNVELEVQGSGNLYRDPNGVEFALCSEITSEYIEEFCSANYEKCKKYVTTFIRQNPGMYSIVEDMIDFQPCAIYLLLNSKSLSEPKEKQDWFDLYRLMNDSQMSKLYEILLKETQKLYYIDIKY